MRKKAALVLLGLFVVSLLLLFSPPIKAQSPSTIHIYADGSIEPPTSSISQTENIYTLTDDVSLTIKIEKDNIVLDGAGHTLMGQIRIEEKSGITVKNLVVKGGGYAFYLYKSNNNTLNGNTITNCQTGFYLWISWRNNITDNNLTNADKAFEFIDKCEYNIIVGNIIQDCGTAIDLKYPNNEFSNNIITGCSDLGILLSADSNLLRNNKLSGNRVNFDISAFNNDLDESNTIAGKPIVLWSDRHDETVPLNAGYVVLVNCDNILVKNLEAEGIAVVSTYNSSIAGNSIVRSKSSFPSANPVDSRGVRWISYGIGIRIIDSQNVVISGNLVWSKDCGIKLSNSAGIQVVGNNVTQNGICGLLLVDSNDNIIEGNVFASNGFSSEDAFGVNILDSSRNQFVGNIVEDNNLWGIRVLGTQRDNIIFHNNFINNKVRDTNLQVSMMGPANPSVWDNGAEGNYWSDYATRYPNASEIGNTGIGDTPFVVNENNIDHYPLMAPYYVSGNAPSLAPSVSSSSQFSSPSPSVPEFPSWMIFTVLSIGAFACAAACKIKRLYAS